MELILVAAAIMVGFGALGAAVGMGLLGENSWKVLLVNRSWVRCCKVKCSFWQA